MSSLSISKAWDETKTIATRDGKLIGTVALALIVFPVTVLGAIVPGGLAAAVLMIAETNSLRLPGFLLVILLMMLTGQLAVTRLAIGPSVSVGAAITSAANRLLSYVTIALIAGAVLFVVLVVAAVLMAAIVAPGLSQEEIARSPAVAIVVVVIVAVYFFLLVRVVGIAGAITTAERLGPIRTISRAWSLTSGHSWPLLGFLIVFMLGTGIAVFAVTVVVASITQLFLGKIETMSASALVSALVSGLASGIVSALLAVMLARIYVQLAGKGARAGVPNSGT
jgi:hypothetical protein